MQSTLLNASPYAKARTRIMCNPPEYATLASNRHVASLLISLFYTGPISSCVNWQALVVSLGYLPAKLPMPEVILFNTKTMLVVVRLGSARNLPSIHVCLGVARLAERSGRDPSCRPRPPFARRSVSWSRRTAEYLGSRVNLGTESLAISLKTEV